MGWFWKNRAKAEEAAKAADVTAASIKPDLESFEQVMRARIWLGEFGRHLRCRECATIRGRFIDICPNCGNDAEPDQIIAREKRNGFNTLVGWDVRGEQSS